MSRSLLQQLVAPPESAQAVQPPFRESSNKNNGTINDIVVVIVSVIASMAMVSLLVAFLYYCHIRRKVRGIAYQRHLKQSLAEYTQPPPATSPSEAQVFTYKQLQHATNNFSPVNIVGHGGFGSVFRAVLADGRCAAIKQLDRAGKQGEHEFRVEVDMLSRLQSQFLLELHGYCADQDHRLLVYEYMPNGSLQEHLYSDGSSGNPPLLDWGTRLRIALDAARGLEYLHELVSPPIIHRDFKSSNILLDENFNAKVSDFGLAKLGSDKIGGYVSTRVLGTHGYVAPEYALTGHLTTKSDVYSYGVVLLELLTGRVPVDMKRPPGQGVLVSWALPRLTDREKLIEMVDPVLQGQFAVKELIQVAAIAAMCVQPEADYRPLMTDVVQSLVPLVKQRATSKVVCTPNFHHQIVTLKSSSIDSGSSGHGHS
ncbi:protein MpRLK-Pelle_Extensin3 [Marchantia polymorpha subsp. ruderalis]